MIQRFIELGGGYGDLYELIEIAETNSHRIRHFLALNTVIGNKEVTSLAIILNPAGEGKFQPIYICREGVPNPRTMPSKRFSLFQEAADRHGKDICELAIKPSSLFAEPELYYQQLIGILRLNHFLPPLS
ncbi:methylthioribose kinase [Neobacillus piezotolerans]|uniref:Methylthioribose kinase n=1 Tax=Neobacillus piezotolerans TaxID=2259171 RepID=A0A3D8GWB1_9BACI|nr:methylthioribose kinase [Neobacillus piezotolerans]RDU38461.1 methylthioribose kinase [Neobacillus piezotolerans]